MRVNPTKRRAKDWRETTDGHVEDETMVVVPVGGVLLLMVVVVVLLKRSILGASNNNIRVSFSQLIEILAVVVLLR